uniref:Reverse transcriptase domain-containing protein n=1 Tax=Paramormyrops kingsleyae TaxID=1676925 RepID=A0A3B3SDN5_9TELE
MVSVVFDRSFSVHLGEFFSSTAPLSCGVPQGSILGPMLFSLYLLPLGNIFRKHNIPFHCYADDVQIYLPVKTNDNTSFLSLFNCLRDLKRWLNQNFLCLNENKTEIIVFGRPGDLSGCVDGLGNLGWYVRPFIRNLGVIFDSDLKFEKQISSVVKASFFQLRLLAKVKPYLPSKAFESAIHAFITTRLDYCNSLYVGLDVSCIQRLQLVQNAAARLLTGTKKYEHITPVLASLHWLPVRYRIVFKVLLFVYKILNGLAPAYLSELLHVHTPARALRSSNQVLLDVPRARLKNKGDRAFSVVAPNL